MEHSDFPSPHCRDSKMARCGLRAPSSQAPITTPISTCFSFFLPESCNIPGDFHWYRLDQGGLWSHKPGQTRAKQEDERGRVITDPRKAATARYRFVAFMTSDTAAVTIA